jgi:hypothetical protein
MYSVLVFKKQYFIYRQCIDKLSSGTLGRNFCVFNSLSFFYKTFLKWNTCCWPTSITVGSPFQNRDLINFAEKGKQIEIDCSLDLLSVRILWLWIFWKDFDIKFYRNLKKIVVLKIYFSLPTVKIHHVFRDSQAFLLKYSVCYAMFYSLQILLKQKHLNQGRINKNILPYCKRENI